jgi:OPT oligopeptide transporter protein
MIGYGLAGICRRWLVYPSDMMWPDQLQTSALLSAMHRNKNQPAGRWTISRYKLFLIVMVIMFGYGMLPQFIPFLAKPNIIPLIWPENKIANILFGLNRGLCLLPFTLSYEMVTAFLGSFPAFINYSN